MFVIWKIKTRKVEMTIIRKCKYCGFDFSFQNEFGIEVGSTLFGWDICNACLGEYQIGDKKTWEKFKSKRFMKGEENTMNIEDEKIELVSAIVKAAIGEMRIFVKSYEPSCTKYDEFIIKIQMNGDVTGELELRGNVMDKVTQLLGMCNSNERLHKCESDLVEANKKVQSLKDRLARLHCLSGPRKDFE